LRGHGLITIKSHPKPAQPHTRLRRNGKDHPDMTSPERTSGDRSPSRTGDVVRNLTPNPISEDRRRRVNLRDLGFVGLVSCAAMDEIRRNENRASRAVTTAATFAFR
jgi:hypothetical protein